MVLYKQRIYLNQFILLILDVLVILGSFRLVCYYQRGDWQFGENYSLFFAIFALLWWILAGQFAAPVAPNPSERLTTYWEKSWALVRTLILHMIVLTAGVVLLQVHLMPLRYLGVLYGLAGVGMMGGRLVLAFLRRTYRYRWGRTQNRFVMVGASRSGIDLYRFLTVHDPAANHFLGFFTDEPAPAEVSHLVLGRLSDLPAFCEHEQVDEMYFALPLDHTDSVEELSSFADDNFISFRIVPDFEGTLRKNVTVQYHDYGPILTVRRHPLGSRANQLSKRAFDLAFSGLVIGGIFPILLPILALLIKLDSPGPVFFKQMRPGKRNKLFPCYKLRTMRTDLSGTELQATKGDARVTRVGRFLRASSLDELPQFFNVWLGHMSVVGPRPNMQSQLEEYSKYIHTYAHRHTVTPGITGYAQVNGYRGETRALGAMEKRVEYDLKYVENWSLLLDLQIILKTVKNMISGEKNAY
ncbi:exopolysaccharide biosynthesis polyprenyl glycosylphosphotransferase [Hymenobacter psoromatis]|uniref:exopolysaccharide biosynthesis polyprenyl glycosylphosphotransferase n=1 Tax=Hymenobacter psoromatis TaxID=1484116 RepID=UPI001CBF6FAF|nr:exopolysaccharide biosynthesis polyprenyl glycosylphosphotransferase [Hymenobacter psoromatis]